MHDGTVCCMMQFGKSYHLQWLNMLSACSGYSFELCTLTMHAHAQEVGWFDREENSSGALSLRLSSDTSAIRGALGDQV